MIAMLAIIFQEHIILQMNQIHLFSTQLVILSLHDRFIALIGLELETETTLPSSKMVYSIVQYFCIATLVTLKSGAFQNGVQ